MVWAKILFLFLRSFHAHILGPDNVALFATRVATLPPFWARITPDQPYLNDVLTMLLVKHHAYNPNNFLHPFSIQQHASHWGELFWKYLIIALSNVNTMVYDAMMWS